MAQIDYRASTCISAIKVVKAPRVAEACKVLQPSRCPLDQGHTSQSNGDDFPVFNDAANEDGGLGNAL